MSATFHCAVCHTVLPGNAADGFCPVCELRAALNPVRDSEQRAASSDRPFHQADQSETRFISDLKKIRYFGDYEILEEVAHGGMGVVFKARQLSLNRIVALKLILSGRFASRQEVSRFRMEAEAAANLRHPNIVSIHQTGECDGQHYFSMDYISGKSLAQLVRDRKVSIDQAVRYVITVAEAIHYAHQQGILHRDLKPSNVLIDEDGQPRITDFGLAKRSDSCLADCGGPNLTKAATVAPREGYSLTATGQLLGSPGYMSPEQASGRKATQRSDVYGLGALLYDLLTGEPPFHADTPMETLRKVIEEEPRHPKALNNLVDRDLDTVCLKCLEKDPQRRYPSAEALAADLRRWIRHEPVSARPAGTLLRLRRWIERSPLRAALIATSALAMAITVFAGWNYWTVRSTLRRVRIREEREWREMHRKDSPLEQLHWASEDLAGFFGKEPRFVPDAKRLYVGVYLENDQEHLVSKFAPLLRSLERSLSSAHDLVRLDLVVYSKRERLERAVTGRDTKAGVHVGRMGEAGLSLLLNDTTAGLVPLVQQASGGKVSVLFARVDTGITNIAGLKNKRLALGSPTSTASGYKVLRLLLEQGLNAQNVQAINHEESEQNVDLVLSGQFDAGVTRLDKFNAYGPTNQTLRILAQFPTTRMPWVATKALTADWAENFKQALVTLNDKAILQNLPENPSDGFVPVDAEYFRKVADDVKKVTREFFGDQGSNQPPMKKVK